jgi:plastocyanin
MKKLILFIVLMISIGMLLSSCTSSSGEIVELTEETDDTADSDEESEDDSSEDEESEAAEEELSDETDESEETTDETSDEEDESEDTGDSEEELDDAEDETDETSEDEESDESSDTEEESTENLIEITDEGFDPSELTIAVGDTVTFSNLREDEYEDEIVMGVRSHSDIESDKLSPGDTWDYTFTEADEYEFVGMYLTIYSLMITVE